MSIPPPGRKSSSTPASKGRPDEDDKKSGKNFQLPGRKDSVNAKEDQQKKKSIFDLSAEEIALQQKQPGLQEAKIAENAAEKSSAIEAKAQISQVSQLIQRMVESMRIGQIDGKDFASLDLKKGPEVPLAFEGSHLTVSYESNGIAIHFDNFMTPQQQNTAITLVEKNKEQLLEMVQALNAKNIQIHELMIGSHNISLPRVQPLPPPFQMSRSAESETQQRGQREQQRRDQEGSGPES